MQRLALELFAQSQYLSDILVRDPELFRWLTTTPALTLTKTRQEYEHEASAAVSLFQRSERKLDALKRFQRRELLRIGAREILGEADVDVTASELSALADAVLEAVFDIQLNEWSMKGGQGATDGLAIIGLGKLGGSELNFSSDIDVMFVYDSDDEIDIAGERIRTKHELYCSIASAVVRSLSEHTDEGHLYRVDMRLRPDGSAGPLAMARAAYRAYYEARGELWERQMLQKARAVAGAREVGEAFLRDVRPFIYPRTHFASPLEQIADIKRKIEAKGDTEANVKLGQGGIRDVEFIVQALQLLYGGTKEHLRASNTLDALERLAGEGILNDGERGRLRQAYLFFRTVEHRLQLLHGMQTHSLPNSTEEMEILRKRLGFRSLNAFRNRLTRHRQHVRRMFDVIFSVPKRGGQTTIVTPAALKKAGVQNRELARRVISALSDEDQSGSLLHTFLVSLKHHRNADAALVNIAQWLESPLPRRPALVGLREMNDVFVLLASRSTILSAALAREPLLLESLIGRPEEILQRGFSWDLLNDLRRFRAFNEFTTVLRFLLGRSTIEQTLEHLSQVAREFVVRQFETACAQQAVDSKRGNVAVVALGKCGGDEMSLRSDLDLVLLYDGGVSVRDACERLAKNLLESSLADGVPVYELDFRLRPEGKNAPLAVEVGYYRRYLHERASLWERQSLTKANVVAGDERLAERFVRIRDEFVYETPLPESWTKDVLLMRSKIERERAAGSGADLKAGRGGLIDLEFLLQAFQLRFGGEHSSLRAENAFRVLDAVEALRLLPKSDVRVLRTNLIFLRTLELAIHLNIENAAFTLPTSSDQLRTLTSFMGTPSVTRLKQRLRVILRHNRQLFRTTLQRCATSCRG